MRIGLLVCDHIQKGFPGYPELFKNLLPKHSFEIFYVCDGLFPKSASEYEAWLITGSKYSVYDEVDWIIKLKSFVVEISQAGKFCIGVCFGHQMLGEAMGGKVAKSENGWCVGVHAFEVLEAQSWMNPFHSKFNLLMSCQDQIQFLPPNSRVLAQSPLCPVGIIQLGSKFLGIQGHPEFTSDYIRFLMIDRSNSIGSELINQGIESLSNQTHNKVIAMWINQFLTQ